MNLMYDVMMGDPEASTLLKEITETSEEAARLAADNIYRTFGHNGGCIPECYKGI